ncbi:MAG TPA: carbamoyltransferase C-terminal domain-containing protein [Thermoanaerobaculia bacterium]|nr:carbamoyltransferase C-terminal domain-containing protein [Thermoanaerobaculia bacterium]
MTSQPTVLGINRTQDASICLLRGQEIIWNIQKERITRVKRHWGALDDLRDCYLPRLPELSEPVDLVVECYSSDPEVRNLSTYRTEIDELIRFRGAPRVEQVSHHLTHLYSAFFPSPFDEAAVMVIDCQGSPVKDFVEDWPDRQSVPAEWLEVSSFYVCRRDGRIECRAKQLWDRDPRRLVGLGHFYRILTKAIFPGRGNEGKVMGLAPYGRPGSLGLPPLIVDGYEVLIPDAWLDLLFNEIRFRFSEENLLAAADLAAEGQQAFEEAILELTRRFRADTGLSSLCLAGGCALNCAANGRLIRESGFERVFVPPGPHDGGTALGCALYGMREILGGDLGFRWEIDYLGPRHDVDAIRRELEQIDKGVLILEEPASLADRVAELLEQQSIVGLFQGRSESGPRALGNRSFLADPRSPAMWRWINERIKSREAFRPLAPAVREELASTYFDVDHPSPFMQFAVDVQPAWREVLGAVTHVDLTARIQTVTPRQNPFLYELLLAFEKRTGLGVVLNTSFNRREEPIVETAGDALRCFLGTDLHALAMPPFLLRKREEPPRP